MIIFADGFDWLPSAASDVVNALYRKWSLSAAGSLTRTNPRVTGNGYSMTIGATGTGHAFPTQTTIYWAGGLKTTTTALNMLDFRMNGTSQLHLYRDGAGDVYLRRGTTQVGPVLTNLPNDTWKYFELKLDFGGTGSTQFYEARVDGVFAASGLGDLTNTANPNVNSFVLTSVSCDDMILYNNSGDLYNNVRDFMGPVKIFTSFPAATGAFSQWTGSDGNSTDNFQLVSGAFDDGATFVQTSGISGRRDTYSIQPPPSTTNIYAVIVNNIAKQVDAATLGIYPNVISSGQYFRGGSGILSNSFQTFTQVFSTNPVSSGTWHRDDVVSLQIGIESI